MRRISIVLFLVAIFSAAASAELAPAPDWAESTNSIGAASFLSPPDETGDQVLYVIGTADPSEGDFDQWFDTQVADVAAELGELAERYGARLFERAPQGVPSTHVYHDTLYIMGENGVGMTAMLYAYGVGDLRQVHVIVFRARPGAANDPRVRAAQRRAMMLWHDGYARIVSAGSADSSDPGSPAPDGSSAPAGTATAPPPATPARSPGAVGEEAVETVVTGRIIRSGGVTLKITVPFLLLKDGRALQERKESPLDLDPRVPVRDTAPPGMWQPAPEGWKILYPDGSFYEIDQSGRLGPAPPNMALEGTYVARGGRYGANWAETLVFHPDGSVTSDQTALVSGPGFSGGDTSSAAARYAISGWTITLTGSGGQTQRFLFAKSGETAPGLICIGDALYLRE